ncbi:MAG: class I adenylate-forming enzyme family protein [Gammaproteobacteria bacterium]
MTIDVENFRQRRNDDRWNRVSVGDVIERVTWSTPDKLALICTADATVNPAYQRLTYAQANALINRLANALLALDPPPAARIAMFCDNSNEAWLTKIAIAKAGLVAAPVNVMMAPDVILETLAHVDARLAIVDQAQWDRLGERLAPAGIRPVMSIGGGATGVAPDFDTFIAPHASDEPDVRIHGDDVWQVLFTSGTTARPKAVMISHTYTYMTAYSHVLTQTRGLDHESDLRHAAFTPMVYHIGDQACIFAPLLAGGSAVMGRKPDGHVIAETCTRERVTCLFGGSPQFVESVIRAVDERPFAYDLSSLTAMHFGWAPLAPGALAAFRRICGPQVKVYEICGQTEAVACHRFHVDRHTDMYLREAPAANHVGLPSPIMAATVFDADGNDLHGRKGVAGEAVYRSPAMFSGYYRDLKATEEALAGGWFHSGDSFVYHDDEVRLMVDRYKDIVKSGGENVSTIRVEAILQQHPHVQRAAVVGVPDERWGEAVVACIIPAVGVSPDAAAIIAFARERLAGFETPKRIVVMDEFPTTVGGKILKYKIRQALAASD